MFSAGSKSPKHPACEVLSMMYACLLKALSYLCHETSTLSAIEIHPPMKKVQHGNPQHLEALNCQVEMLAVYDLWPCPESPGPVDKK